MVKPFRAAHSAQVVTTKSCADNAAHFKELAKGLGAKPLNAAVMAFNGGDALSVAGLWGFPNWPGELSAGQLDMGHPLVQRDNQLVAMDTRISTRPMTANGAILAVKALQP